VAAGAIVTRDVAPYAIVAGNPARFQRHRQPPEMAERQIALGRWDWEHKRLRAALSDFRALPALAFLER
jgi:serine acetyltransferase